MRQEPTIAVGLIENSTAVTIELLADYADSRGNRYTPDSYRYSVENGTVLINGTPTDEYMVALSGTTSESLFRVQIIIGIDFHWQQEKTRTFRGNLRLLASPGNTLTVINDLPLEAYLGEAREKHRTVYEI